MLEQARTMSVTSAAGTDLTVGLGGSVLRRITRLHRSAGRHRPLAGRAGAGVPGGGHGQRHARAGARRRQPDLQGVRALGDHVDDRRRSHHVDRRRWCRRGTVRVVPRVVRRAGGVRHQPRRLGHEPGGPLGGAGALRQVAAQRHRAACLRRQLPLLDRRQRGRRSLLPRSLRSADAGLHGRPRRSPSWSSRAD